MAELQRQEDECVRNRDFFGAAEAKKQLEAKLSDAWEVAQSAEHAGSLPCDTGGDDGLSAANHRGDEA